MSKNIKYKTVVKCPVCKYKKEFTMSEDQRILVYDCKECKARLKAKGSECCIYCVYGTVPCPTAQAKVQQKGEA